MANWRAIEKTLLEAATQLRLGRSAAVVLAGSGNRARPCWKTKGQSPDPDLRRRLTRYAPVRSSAPGRSSLSMMSDSIT
jgi:hypothetical protein